MRETGVQLFMLGNVSAEMISVSFQSGRCEAVCAVSPWTSWATLNFPHLVLQRERYGALVTSA